MADSERTRVILISIDGLWPDLYLDGTLASPRLRKLAARGIQALRAQPVFPTLTYTNHASIATGAYSDKHGIYANTRFSPDEVTSWQGGESQAWLHHASNFRISPIWDIAEEYGYQTALIRWPSTVGAKSRWLVPDIFSVDGSSSVWDLILKSSTPELIQALKRKPGFQSPSDDHLELDQLTAQISLLLLENEDPDLLMLHFTSLDHEAHEHGTHSPRIPDLVEKLSSWVEQIVAAADPNRSIVFVFGDHGFLDFKKRININSLFAQNGWIKTSHDDAISDWQVIAHTNCSVAPIFLRNGVAESEVMACLRENAGSYYRILSSDELRRLHAYPDAFCAIEANPGFSLGQDLSGPLISDIEDVRGEHGYSPELPEMATGFFALGKGLQPGAQIEELGLIDIAPTVASIMNFRLPNCDGSLIPLTSPRSQKYRNLGGEVEYQHHHANSER